MYLLGNMKRGLFFSSGSIGVVTVNVILVFTLAISLISVGSVQAASNNIIVPSSINSTKPPKPPKPLPAPTPLNAGKYKVTESGNSGYSTSYSSGCSGTATGGRIQCTITNQYNGTHTPPNPTPNEHNINQ